MIKIRKAKYSDCKFCYDLSKIKELITPSQDSLPLYYFKEFIKEKQIFFVAEEKRTILGYVMGERVTGNIALLWMITVKRDLRGKSIGTILLKNFEKECKKRKLKWIVLHAPNFNKKTLNFYKKHKYNTGLHLVEFNKEIK